MTPNPGEAFRTELLRFNKEPNLQASDFTLEHEDSKQRITVFLVRDRESAEAIRLLLTGITEHNQGLITDRRERE